MRKLKIGFRIFVLFVVLGLAGVIYYKFYSYIFKRHVKGVVESVERVNLDVALMQSSGTKVNPALFSFSVAIRESTGEIVTASAEDRQWAVAQKGQCVEATVYPYPPWELMKGGTFYNARLDRLSDCSRELPPQ